MVSRRPVERAVSTTGTWIPGSPLQHLAIEGHVAGLALVVELLAQPCRNLGMNFAGIDGPVVAGVDREDEPELADVGRHRRRHVRVLQLAGERRAVVPRGAVHLAEGGRGRCLRLEIGEGRSASRGRARRPCAA